jgi:hypothetical protein
LHGWKIDKTVEPLPDDVRLSLLSVLQSRWSYSLEDIRCFEPGMAFSFGQGRQRVEVLICLHCRKAYFAKGDQVAHTNLNESATRKLREIYGRLFGPA